MCNEKKESKYDKLNYVRISTQRFEIRNEPRFRDYLFYKIFKQEVMDTIRVMIEVSSNRYDKEPTIVKYTVILNGETLPSIYSACGSLMRSNFYIGLLEPLRKIYRSENRWMTTYKPDDLAEKIRDIVFDDFGVFEASIVNISTLFNKMNLVMNSKMKK